MNMPGMAGEAAVYKTNNHYRSIVGGSLANNGDMTVVPQDCGIVQGIFCYGGVSVIAAVCGGFCLACISTLDALVCAAAAACVLNSKACFYATCHDCFPGFITKAVDSYLTGGGGGGGAGGGGDYGCCAGGTCCGECQLNEYGRYHCYGQCIGPGQECP